MAAYWRVRAVFVEFGHKVDSRTGLPLFNKNTWAKANNILKEIGLQTLEELNEEHIPAELAEASAHASPGGFDFGDGDGDVDDNVIMHGGNDDGVLLAWPTAPLRALMQPPGLDAMYSSDLQGPRYVGLEMIGRVGETVPSFPPQRRCNW